jgi:hypothetical protein
MHWIGAYGVPFHAVADNSTVLQGMNHHGLLYSFNIPFMYSINRLIMASTSSMGVVLADLSN